MNRQDHLIVGYDGGSTGRDALHFGVRWAMASGDRLVVVTVHPGAADPGIQRVDAEWAAYEREQAQAVLEEAKTLLPGSVDAEFVRVDASSSSAGLYRLVEGGGTMLVLGARKARGLRRTYPGTTAERMLHGASIPVTVVPSDYAKQPLEPLRRVVVAFVDTPDGHAAVETAARIAKHLSGELTVLTVVPDTRVSPAMGEPHRFATDQDADYRTALDAAVASVDAGVTVTGRLMQGPVIEALVDIEPAEADLLLLGSRGYGPLASVLLGGVSSRVVRHARVPLGVVPRPQR